MFNIGPGATGITVICGDSAHSGPAETSSEVLMLIRFAYRGQETKL